MASLWMIRNSKTSCTYICMITEKTHSSLKFKTNDKKKKKKKKKLFMFLQLRLI